MKRQQKDGRSEENPWKAFWIGQLLYTEQILNKFNMDQAKPMETSVNAKKKLTQTTQDSENVDKSLYKSNVKSQIYLFITEIIPVLTYYSQHVMLQNFAQGLLDSCKVYYEVFEGFNFIWPSI